jgi:oligoribonuclease
MSSRPECPDCGERACYGKPNGDGCGADWNPGGGERHGLKPDTGCVCHEAAVASRPTAPAFFYLAFLDFETTGLLPREGAEPIEVAVLVTDSRLNELGRFEALIATTLKNSDWDSPAFQMHAQSGLLDHVLARGRHREDVRLELGVWFTATVPAGAQLHLAGNSVHFDRGFLQVYFPEIERRFHHRHLDVSSIRIVGEMFTSATPLGGEKPHRAMADVLRSISELRHWREALRG